MDRSSQSAGGRPDRTIVRHAAGPLGKRNAAGRNRQHRCRRSFLRDAFCPGMGGAFHGGTAQPAQCASTVGSRAAAGRNSKRARGTPGGRRSHRQLGRNPLGRATRRSVRGTLRCAGGSRTTTGWLALATFPGRYLRLRYCPAPALRAVSPCGLRPPGLTAHTLSKVYKSAPPNHPWRTFLLCVDRLVTNSGKIVG
jgi:hypothetical protein